MTTKKTEKRKPQTKRGKYSSRLTKSTQHNPDVTFRMDDDFYRMLVESIDGYAVFTTDKGGIVSSWNSGAEKLLGYTEKEIIGKNVEILFTETDKKKNEPTRELQTAVKKGSAKDERWHVKKGGKKFWASGLVFPLTDEVGQLHGFTKVMRDLSHKKQIEIEEQRLKNLFQHAPAFICTLKGPDHIFELANPQYFQLVGHRDIIGKSVAKALPEVVDQGFIKILDSVYMTGKPYSGNEVEVTFQPKKNKPQETRYVNFVYQPITDADGSVSGIFAHGVDVTEQVLARKKVEESEKQLRLYVEALPQMAFIADAEGNIIFYNQRWYDYVDGMKGTEGWGWKDKQIHHPDDLERTTERWLHSLKTGDPYEIEYRLRRHDGEYRWHLGRAVPLRNEKGEIIQWIGTNTDIHEQKRAMEQRDEFLGIASHELKTPVTSIKAYGQVLETLFRKKGDIKAAEYLQKMDSQVNKLTNLIGDLLDVTKIQTGRLQFHEDFFDLNELVNEVVDDLQLTTDRHTLEKKLARSKIVYSDRDRIGQVLTNLISNAIKYSPLDREIIISSQNSKDAVTVCIQDFGVGIPKDKQEKVFEQFFRVSGPNQSTFPGMGLGLFISNQIIQRQGGKIWVESVGGKGSKFYFSLPLKRKKVKQQHNNLAEEEVKHE